MTQATTTDTRKVPVPLEKRIERTDADFTDGLCSGYLTYFDQYQGKQLSDRDIHGLFVNWLADAKYTDLFNAGYIVSFIEAVIEDRDLFAR